MLGFSLAVLLILGIVACKKKASTATSVNIISTTDNTKTINILTTSISNNDFFGTCSSADAFLIMTATIKVFNEKTKLWDTFGPGVELGGLDSSNPEKRFYPVKVPKTGKYSIEVSFTTDRCVYCCKNKTPITTEYKTCGGPGKPVWRGSKEASGNEPANVDIVVAPRFIACSCC